MCADPQMLLNDRFSRLKTREKSLDTSNTIDTAAIYFLTLLQWDDSFETERWILPPKGRSPLFGSRVTATTRSGFVSLSYID